MRISYYPETDSLYIDLSAKKSSESREVSPGIVLDYDDENNLVGIDIDNASNKIVLIKGQGLRHFFPPMPGLFGKYFILLRLNTQAVEHGRIWHVMLFFI